jgi:O-antigen ligase
MRTLNYIEQRSLTERKTQLTEFAGIFKNNFLFGVGPGNYAIKLSQTYPQLLVWEVQPVHNIYLLFLAEWGTAGVLIIFGMFKKFKFLLNKQFLPALAVVCVAGMFDHWLLSMFSGIVLFFITLFLALKAPHDCIDIKISKV